MAQWLLTEMYNIRREFEVAQRHQKVTLAERYVVRLKHSESMCGGGAWEAEETNCLELETHYNYRTFNTFDQH